MELILVGLAVSIIIIYHFYYWHQIKSDPAHTVFGFGRSVRSLWVEKILSDPKNFLLGVQVSYAIPKMESNFYPLQYKCAGCGWKHAWSHIPQTMRNEILAGQFLAQASFIALSVIVGASTSVDLPLKLKVRCQFSFSLCLFFLFHALGIVCASTS
jgi:hypothetical protein